jgi:AhpD family alkylhydroperoxidase
MSQRLNYQQILNKEVPHLAALEGLVEKSGLPLNLIEMVRLKASIINGCALCVSIHMRRLRQQGENEMRIDLVSAWREAPCYTERERAIFEYTETLTRISHTQQVTDELYVLMQKHFNEKELATLTLAIGLINLWNRFAVTFHADLGRIDQLLAQSKLVDERVAEQLRNA